MKKILIAFVLLAGAANGQTYNVSVTNSLLGPVDLLFTDTVVTVSGDVVLTGSVFNASVTNTFSPQNDIFVTNEVTVGGTTVNNTNLFISYITNDIDVAGVVITNIIQFVTETNNFVITGAVTSVNSATGDVTLTVISTTNDAGIATWNGTELQIGTNLPAVGGGGLDHWASDTGTATQVGSWFYPTNDTTIGLFIGTNNSISAVRPDGTASGGNARSPNSVDLQVERNNVLQVAGGAERNTLIGTYRATITGGDGHVILGGRSGSTGPTISAGKGHFIVAHAGTAASIISSSGEGNSIISAGAAGQEIISGSADASIIMAGIGLNEISGASAGSIIGAGYDNEITAGQAHVIFAGRFNRASGSTILGSGSAIIGGYRTTNTVEGVISMGHYVNNDHRGSFAYSHYDGTTTRWATTASNQAIWRVQNGFGINTNNPQESLHVDGKIQILDVKIYASGTNLYLTDGVNYTNLITTTPL